MLDASKHGTEVMGGPCGVWGSRTACLALMSLRTAIRMQPSVPCRGDPSSAMHCGDLGLRGQFSLTKHPMEFDVFHSTCIRYHVRMELVRGWHRRGMWGRTPLTCD